VAGEVERQDAERGVAAGQAVRECGEVASAAEEAVQQDDRARSLAGAEDQDARRRPERISYSSWARSEAPRIRDRLPQYRQWMNAGSISRK
jgi:hypothetical protein